MQLRVLLFWCLQLSSLSSVHGAWSLSTLYDLFHRLRKDGSCNKKVIFPVPKENCDENQLMVQLARLYITCPERITLLVTQDPLQESCEDIRKVLQNIAETQANCIPLPRDNLYTRLHVALLHYQQSICAKPSAEPRNHVINYHSCLKELHDDLIDCEGPPDWYERDNKTSVCEIWKNIVNCNYVKTAMLCGLKPAKLLRDFSNDILAKVVLYKCKVPRTLPHVADPMPCAAYLANAPVQVNYSIMLLLSMFFN